MPMVVGRHEYVICQRCCPGLLSGFQTRAQRGGSVLHPRRTLLLGPGGCGVCVRAFLPFSVN